MDLFKKLDKSGKKLRSPNIQGKNAVNYGHVPRQLEYLQIIRTFSHLTIPVS